MATQRKQVTFDLDTTALQKYYPTDNWRYAYEVIKKHMLKNEFSWQEGSVYVSDKPMTARTVSAVLTKLVHENPWLNVCMRDCRQANIGREHSQNYLFDKNAKVTPRERASTMDSYLAKIAAMREEGQTSKPDRQQHKPKKDLAR